MSNELIIQNDFASQLKEFEQIQETCKKLLATKHYASLGEAGIHGIIARAKTLGIHPFEALNGGFICINGKIGLSTEMMMALVRKKGHSITKDAKSNGDCVILHGRRADNGDTWTCKFDRGDAEAAGLANTATWKKYFSTMLYNRCASMLFRQLFPDLSLGAGYVEDELKEIAKQGDYKHLEGDIDITPSNSIHLCIEPPKTINLEQAKELKHILDECDASYRDQIKETIKIHLKAATWNDIPLESYEALKNAALRNRDEYFARQESEFENNKILETPNE